MRVYSNHPLPRTKIKSAYTNRISMAGLVPITYLEEVVKKKTQPASPIAMVLMRILIKCVPRHKLSEKPKRAAGAQTFLESNNAKLIALSFSPTIGFGSLRSSHRRKWYG